MSKKIPRGVWFLGLTSLLTDTSSEMVYPLIPVFLTQVLGATVLFVGLFEGVAESAASLTKFIAGYLSDRTRSRETWVLSGYGLANTARPLIGLVTAPWHALALRFIDRIGKGVRTAPRDAWLVSLATPETRGAVFGFHRMMDHAGATVGPVLATIILLFAPAHLRWVFLLSLIPGWLALFAIVKAREADPAAAQLSPSPDGTKRPLPNLRKMPGRFRAFLGIVLLFTLGNSSDAFLLLKLQRSGWESRWIPLLWAGLHLVKSGTSLWGGRLSDRIGRKRAITVGWLWYAVIYAGLAFAGTRGGVLVLFLAYGLFYGLTESPEKALVADFAPAEEKGSAFGLYHLALGIGALPASILFGWIWMKASPHAAFLTGAVIALIACLMLSVLPLPRGRADELVSI